MVEPIKKAKTELVLVDNYVDVSTLNILCKKNKEVDVVIVTAGKGKLRHYEVGRTGFDRQPFR